ncbi:unnamed protein product [Somion occarium]|uniref:Uncharacterized protein n=1 Tax=Somion occarium TaxID=3059160 RepID=A0ABP1D4X7_9APHY
MLLFSSAQQLVPHMCSSHLFGPPSLWTHWKPIPIVLTTVPPGLEIQCNAKPDQGHEVFLSLLFLSACPAHMRIQNADTGLYMDVKGSSQDNFSGPGTHSLINRSTSRSPRIKCQPWDSCGQLTALSVLCTGRAPVPRLLVVPPMICGDPVQSRCLTPPSAPATRIPLEPQSGAFNQT